MQNLVVLCRCRSIIAAATYTVGKAKKLLKEYITKTGNTIQSVAFPISPPPPPPRDVVFGRRRQNTPGPP